MSSRADAVRRAAAVRAQRAAAIAAREAAIGAGLAEFFEATASGEQVLQVARRRCEEVMAAARASAGRARARAGAAVVALEGLGLGRAEIAEMTGVGVRSLRDLVVQVTTSPEAADDDRASHGSGGAVGAAVAPHAPVEAHGQGPTVQEFHDPGGDNSTLQDPVGDHPVRGSARVGRADSAAAPGGTPAPE